MFTKLHSDVMTKPAKTLTTQLGRGVPGGATQSRVVEKGRDCSYCCRERRSCTAVRDSAQSRKRPVGLTQTSALDRHADRILNDKHPSHAKSTASCVGR